MKKTYILCIVAAIIITGCKKDNTPPPLPDPKADFSINKNTSNEITIAQNDYVVLNNNSQNAVSYLWDLGNGNTSTAKEVATTFDVAGTYDISLTIKNGDGKTAVLKKKLKVFNAVLKYITIGSLAPLSSEHQSTPPMSKAEVWLEITKREIGVEYPTLPNGSEDAPVIYKSPIFQYTTNNQTPTTFTLPDKKIMDVKQIRDRLYRVRLFAKDQTGTYMILYSGGGGAGDLYNGFISSNKFAWDVTFSAYRVDLTGNFQE